MQEIGTKPIPSCNKRSLCKKGPNENIYKGGGDNTPSMLIIRYGKELKHHVLDIFYQ